MKVAGLCWLSVVLTFVLSTGDTVTAVEENQLTTIVSRLKNQYTSTITSMYSLAASIPGGSSNNLQTIFDANPQNNVQNHMNNPTGKYVGQRLAIAKVKKPEHAEYRLLKDLNLVSNQNDLLVIYSYASSCPGTCTNRNNYYNILQLIQTLIRNGRWTDKAFVFEKIFMPRGTVQFNQNELTNALRNLGAVIGLQNIYRCYKPQSARSVQCIRCFSGNPITVQNGCIDYNA